MMKVLQLIYLFSTEKTDTTPENLGIPSLHFCHINKVSQIFSNVREGEDIPKDCEPTPEII